MLTPEQIQAMTDGLVEVYRGIEDDLIANVARRFSVTDSVTPDTIGEWQTEKLNQLGALRRDNIRAIAKRSGKTEREIRRILTDAGYQAIELDEAIYQQAFSEGLLRTAPLPANLSPVLQTALQGAIDNTRKYFNLVNTTALESAQKGFIGIVNQTYLETSLGVTDYNTAMRKAVRNLADKGFTGARYISARGKETFAHLDVAVRRAIITSTAQTAGVMQEQRAKEWGSNLVEVSSHTGARPSHAAWQGRVYSLEGGTPKYPNLRASTGYGSVTGLCGANCGHFFFPFFEGLSERAYKPYDEKENEAVYKQSQQQRKLEREIREQKRRILAAENSGDAEGKKAAQLKLKDKEAKLKDFTRASGRYQRTNRQQADQFGRSEAQKAVWTKKKVETQ